MLFVPWSCRRVVVYLLAIAIPALTSCSSKNEGSDLAPSGAWEALGSLTSCLSGALGLDAQDRPLLVCSTPSMATNRSSPVLASWNGQRFDETSLDFLSSSDAPIECNRIFTLGEGGPRVGCVTEAGLMLAARDGPKGSWGAAERVAAGDDQLLALRASGWGYGHTVLHRHGDRAMVREWRRSAEQWGVSRWSEPLSLSSAQVGAADLATTDKGWHAAYADLSRGGRLRLEYAIDDALAGDLPDLSSEAVDLVRMKVYGTNPTALVIAYRVKDGPLRVLRGVRDTLELLPDVTSNKVGEVALANPGPFAAVVYTDLEQGAALFVTRTLFSAWSTPLQLSGGAAAGISTAPSRVAFCDQAVSPARARVVRYDESPLLDLALPELGGTCLGTQILAGLNALVVAVLLETTSGRVVRVFKRDQDGRWLEEGSLDVDADARSLALLWTEAAKNSQSPEPMVVGWQGTPSGSTLAEPQLAQLATGTWRYTEQLGEYRHDLTCSGPRGRVYVAAYGDELAVVGSRSDRAREAGGPGGASRRSRHPGWHPHDLRHPSRSRRASSASR